MGSIGRNFRPERMGYENFSNSDKADGLHVCQQCNDANYFPCVESHIHNSNSPNIPPRA